MKDVEEYFDSYRTGLIGELNTIAIGEIERFDPIKMKADVMLLPEKELILDVPVGTFQTKKFFIRIPYEKGDPVMVAFAQRDIDNIMHGGNESPSERMLSKDDAIVICGINRFKDSLPAENTDKLVLAEKGGASVAIGGGEIILDGNVKVNGTPLTPGGNSF